MIDLADAPIASHEGELLSASIALCTYNGAQYLSEQLESISGQSKLPHELVVGDDCSSDGTISLISNFAKTAPFPVKLLNCSKTLGYKENFMRVAAACSGDVIFFCDQDDVWDLDKISIVMDEFRQPDAPLLVSHNARIVEHDGTFTGFFVDDRTERQVYNELTLNPWKHPLGYTEAFQRQVLAFADHRTSGPALEEDWSAHDQFVYLVSTSIGRVVYLPQPLVDYRQHSKNAYGLRRTNESRLGKLWWKLNDFADYQTLRNVSLRMSNMLSSGKGGRAGRLSEASQWWQRLAELYELRYIAYSSSSILKRVAAIRSLTQKRAYSDAEPGFNAGGLYRDIVQGVLFARLQRGGHRPYDFGLRASNAAADLMAFEGVE